MSYSTAQADVFSLGFVTTFTFNLSEFINGKPKSNQQIKEKLDS